MQHAAPVDSPQQFCLRWNNYQSNLTNVFDQLLQSESFVDVTLACDGHSVKAHKMVLSACSPYFQSLFFDTPCQHPIVILKDIKWTELKAVVEFMYKGEINVSQEQIGPLLKVAESLKIRGLADVNSDSEFGSVDAAKKTSSGWDSRQSTPFVQDLSESAMSPSSILHRQKKRRRTSGERSSISSPEESIGGGDTDIGNSTLDMSPHTPSAAGAGPMVNSHTIMPPNHNHPPPQSGPPNIVNLSSETTVGLPLPPPPPPPPPSSHMMDDLEIKPGIAEMIREEERAKLLESSQAWLGASTSSIAVDSYQYQLQSMWQKCWNTNQSLVHNLRFRERGPLKSWRPETMAEAIFSVLKEGLSLSQAARKYDIPYPTFVLYANRVHNMLGPSSDGGADLRPKGRGRPQRILLGSWPEEHIRGVIRAVVFRDPQHIKEEQQHLAYSRLPVCSSDLAEPLSSQGYVSPLPNGPEPSVSPGAAAAAAVAAVAQGLRQQMCNMVAAAQQHQHEANLMNSLGSLMNRCNSLGLPTNGNSHCLPPLSLHSPTSPIGSSPTPSPEVEVGLGLTYKPPLNFSSPRPEALFQEDLEDIVGSPDGFIKNSSDSFKTPSDSFLKSSAENFMKSAAENFMKSSENFVKPPDSFMKTPTNSFKPPSDNFMKSPSDNFMKSPSNNFGKSPSDNFGKSSDNFGKTSDNFGKSPSDNFGKSDNFKSPSDGFNKNSSDSFARSPDCFAKSPSDSFTKSPSDSFVKTPSDNFVRPPSVKQEPMMEASQNME